MFDQWKLMDFAPGHGYAAGAHAADYDDHAWLPIPVPGDVHRALIAAGRIADPFYDTNEIECAWMEDREWWYRLRFTAPPEPPQPGERLRLIFHGLDTFATIWLNGEELGRHANMFYPAVFDVTNRLRPGTDNTLAVCFDRPLDHIGGVDVENWWGGPAPRIAMRKAQFGYGWDWGPRLPTIGLWRPVELVREHRAAIAGVHPYTLEIDRARERALVAIRVEADLFATSQPLQAHIRLLDPDGAQTGATTLRLERAHSAETAYLQVERAQFWWTHDLGTPALYTVEVTLAQDAQTLDRRQLQMGIRTLYLDQSPDPQEVGTRFFRFVLNGVPLFAKGANWIPADSFVGAIPPERYAALIEAARDAHMTMLRVWGGGIYEHDAFYETCDRLGILVWQDFMFACAPYPDHIPAFVDEVKAEARYQVRRLRHHPCLALWCGNNENQWLHDMATWNQWPDNAVPGSLFYDTVLPGIVADEDGRTPYWPGSPYGGNDYNSMDDGDRHNWDVWHGNRPRRFLEPPQTDQTPEGVSFLHYADDMGRFISEFGMHAAPVLETLRRVIPEDQLYHHSPSMDHHNKDNPKNKGDNLMQTVTGLPSTLDDYIDFSMIAQAEGLKFGVEHYRRRMPHCSGTLVWQLNDCWPVLSWSVLDYYGIGKAGYYYLKRAYTPVLASFKALGDGAVALWVTNDTETDVEETVTVRLGTFDGGTVWEESHRVSVPALTSRPVLRWDGAYVGAAPDRYLAVRAEGGTIPANRHFFAAIKDLQREKPQLTVEKRALGPREVEVRLHAPAYAYFVHLTAPHEHTRFGDNYFDLWPHESRAITVTAPEDLDPEAIAVLWR